MPLRIGRAHTALSGVLDHTSTPVRANSVTRHSSIWITDELLRDTVERSRITKLHTRQCKRHGSTVPGPLEARRRQAKRRMNNLAVSGHDSSFRGDPMLLLQDWFLELWNDSKAPKELQWLWQAPKSFKEREREKPSAELHPVNKFIESLIFPEKTRAARKKEKEKKMFGQPQGELASISRADFRRNLHDVKDLADLENLYDRIGSASVDALHCSRAAFNHLLQLHTPTDDLFEFLGNSKLNTAYGSNLLTIFRSCTFDRDEFSDAVTLLEQGVFQRIISSRQLLDILISFPTAAAHSFESLGDSVMLDAIDRVCNCIKRSNLNASAKSLKAFLDHSLRQIVNPPTDQIRASVFAMVLESVISSWKTTLSTDWDALQLAFARTVARHWKVKQALIKEIPESIKTAFNFQTLLDNFPAQLVRFALAYMSQSLSTRFSLASEPDQEAVLEDVNALLEEIRGLEFNWVTDPLWAQIYDQLAANIEPAKISSHFMVLNHSEKCRVLLRHWIPLDISKSSLGEDNLINEKSQHQGSLEEMIERLEQDFDGVCKQDIWPCTKRSTGACASYLSLLKVLKDSGLPHAKTFEILLGLMLALNRRKTFHDIVLYAKSDLGISVDATQRHIVAKYVNLTGSTRAALAYRVFCADDGLVLSHCPDLVLHCVGHIGWELHPWSICELLEEPDPLAVRDGTSQRPMDLIPWNLKSGGTLLAPLKLTRADRFPAGSAYSYRRLDLIHETALAFVTSERLSNNTAWKAASRCWKLLVTSGRTSHIDSRITKALIQSGIIRPLHAKGKEQREKEEQEQQVEHNKIASGNLRSLHLPGGVFGAVQAAVKRVDGATYAKQLVYETNALAYRLARPVEEEQQQAGAKEEVLQNTDRSIER